jgi:hypothetical protein
MTRRTWAQLAWISGGKFLGRSRIISFGHFRSRVIFEITTSKRRANIYTFFGRHVALTLTKVNTYALLYEWKGSDVSLKPLLFTAHQGLSDYVGYFHRRH